MPLALQTMAAVLAILGIFLAPAVAAADDTCPLQRIIKETPAYDCNGDQGACNQPTATPVTGTLSTSDTQSAVAKMIMGIAKTDNIGQQGAIIGLMVGMAESSLTVLANPNVPASESVPTKQGNGSDHDSVGVFQQRVSTGWSTQSGDAAIAAQLMDYNGSNTTLTGYSAEAFFGSPPGSNAPSAISKGLQNKSGWQTMTPWQAAQAVQASAFSDGSNYEPYLGRAQALVAQYWATAPALPLPVPLTGQTAGTVTSPVGANSNSCSGVNAMSAGFVTCNGNTPATSNLSAVRQRAVCIANQELALWTSHPPQLTPGFASFKKYSQNMDELWCADFVSWVYNQANYPLTGNAKNWRLANVTLIKEVGQKNQLFHWHAAGSGYVPKPGDLVAHNGYDKNGDLQVDEHVNMVTAITGSKISMVGGDQDAPNGDYPDGSYVSDGSYTNYASPGNLIDGFISPDDSSTTLNL